MTKLSKFSETKRFLSYSRNFFPILISFFMVAISAGAYTYVWQNYRFQATEEKLQQQIASLEIQLQQEQKEKSILQKDLDAMVSENQGDSNSLLSNEDKKYVSDALGVDFNYYLDFGFDEDSYNDDVDGEFGLCSSQNDFCVIGVNHESYHSDVPGAYSSCAAKYKDMNQFCENGCEKISENIAIDYRTSGYGDREFSAMIYSDLSAKYSSLCFALNLNDALDEASKKKGAGYYDISDSDVKSMIKNRELSEAILQKTDAFEKMARTVKKIE